MKILLARGAKVRVMVRNPDKAAGLRGSGVELAKGDFADPASMESAMRGCERAFLLPPVDQGMVAAQEAFIDAVKRAGVRHVVKLSAVGARLGAPHRFGDWHGRGEEYLKKSGVGWTMLRPSFFMQNWLTMAEMVKAGTIYLPCGEGKAPFVDVRDIAAVAAGALASEGHGGKVYDVTGPAALGYAEVAAIFSRVLGRAVKYVDVPAEAAKQSMMGAGMPEWLAEGINELNAEMKAGSFSRVTSVVREVGGKEAVTAEQFIRENAKAFGG